MKRAITGHIVLLYACAVPMTGAGFGMIETIDQTVPGPGGRHGFFQTIQYSSTLPGPVISTYLCSGAMTTPIPGITRRLDHPFALSPASIMEAALAASMRTDLRELWASDAYHTNSLPAVWKPERIPPTTKDLSAYMGFRAENSSIRKFIGQYGLPSRYLVARGTRTQDFLIYDLASGHSVALYVPPPPADTFTAAVVVDSAGGLVRMIK